MNNTNGVNKLNSKLSDLDLIDLISERHIQLRAICEELWNHNSNIYISNSEWFIIAKTYKNKPKISYIAKQVNVSRQAAHKLVKNLSSKGLVQIYSIENNNRDKYIALTPLGDECYEKNLFIKASLEKKIIASIGLKQFTLIKELLCLDWELEI